jgi:hypothetical protein
LIEKIQTLPPDRLTEVEDFVNFIELREQQRRLTRDATAASAPASAGSKDARPAGRAAGWPHRPACRMT